MAPSYPPEPRLNKREVKIKSAECFLDGGNRQCSHSQDPLHKSCSHGLNLLKLLTEVNPPSSLRIVCVRDLMLATTSQLHYLCGHMTRQERNCLQHCAVNFSSCAGCLDKISVVLCLGPCSTDVKR